jgi:hypothetical protein
MLVAGRIALRDRLKNLLTGARESGGFDNYAGGHLRQPVPWADRTWRDRRGAEGPGLS